MIFYQLLYIKEYITFGCSSILPYYHNYLFLNQYKFFELVQKVSTVTTVPMVLVSKVVIIPLLGTFSNLINLAIITATHYWYSLWFAC